jgi:hypothetical protein
MEITGPVLDADDPVGLAEFYSRMLGWPIVEQEGPRPGFPEADGWAKIRDPEARMKIEFQWDADYVAPTWPTVTGDQLMMMHLDDGVAWAIECGATVAAHQPQDGVRVMLDPAGHPFCLFDTTP